MQTICNRFLHQINFLLILDWFHSKEYESLTAIGHNMTGKSFSFDLIMLLTMPLDYSFRSNQIQQVISSHRMMNDLAAEVS
jgi:hypothetical protein